MAETDNLGLPLIEAGQAQKHITHNEALRLLDVVVQLAVESVISTPPGSPVTGERRIVGASPTGAFAGHANEVAAYQDGAWFFAAPQPGWRAWDIAEEVLLIWNGSVWTEFAAGEGGGGGGGGGGEFDPENVEFLYINGADPEEESTKLAVHSNEILFDAVTAAESGTGDVRLQLSKEGTSDTASVFFSHAFDGRAEFGLVGTNDFRLKVSADGDTWVTSLLVNPANGIVSLPLGADLGASEATAAQYRSNTADKILSTDQVWSAAALVALSDGATIAVDMSTGFNFSVTLGGNRTLGNPTNTKVGQSGAIVVGATGSTRTLALSSNWKANAGLSFPVSIATSDVAILFYWVESSTKIRITGLWTGAV
jgi:hypothetical protein